VATQVAIAIENLYTYQQPLQYRQHLIALERFSQAISQYLDIDIILQQTIRAVKSLFQSDRISILLANENNTSLKVAYAIGIPQEEWQKQIPMKESIAGKVFLKNRPLLLTNTKNVRNFLQSSTKNPYRSRSCILSPIQVTSYQGQKRAIGVLCVTDKQDLSPFTHLECNLLALLANQVGTTLTNAFLYEKATTDSLTKVCSRGYFFQRLQEEIQNARRNATPLALLMLDLDHFKMVNDTYTHQSGDKILQQIGSLLKEIVGEKKFVGRYGGEEFLILLLDDKRGALARAEEIRNKIASYTFSIAPAQNIAMTSSIGVSFLRDTDAIPLLIERSDQSLYIAKRKGRNCVVTEEELALSQPKSIEKKAKLI
jgi:diguanylate cyclase (GGDEF)-like protein